MRIGIDARTLSGRFTGDRTYWRGLIGGLAAIDSRERVFSLHAAAAGRANRRRGWGRISTGGRFQRRQTMPSGCCSVSHKPSKRTKSTSRTRSITFLCSALPARLSRRCMTFRFASIPTCFSRKTAGYSIRSSRAPCAGQRRSSPSPKAPGGTSCGYYQGIPQEQVRVVLEAADARFHPPEDGQETARAAVNKRLGLDDRPYLLAVGVLQPRKNLALLLDAFALLKLGPKSSRRRTGCWSPASAAGWTARTRNWRSCPKKCSGRLF